MSSARRSRTSAGQGRLDGTAREYAGKAGHRKYPVLSATYAPESGVPCVDFSPWIRARLVAGDVPAVQEYVRQLLEPNPGISFDLGTGAATVSRSTAPVFDTHPEIATVRRICEADLGKHLAGLTPDAELDLRVALVVCSGALNHFALVQLGPDGPGSYLAAVMSPYEVQLRDPAAVLAIVRGHIAAGKAGPLLHAPDEDLSDIDDDVDKDEGYESAPAWLELEPYTLAQVQGGAAAGAAQARAALKALPHGGRTHVFELWQMIGFNRLIGDHERFGPLYPTRSRGSDDAASVQLLLELGVLCDVTDLRRRREYLVKSTTAVRLKEMLADAGVPYAKSATKTKLVALIDEHLPGHLDALETKAQIIEPTPYGRYLAEFVADRVICNERMWASWLAVCDFSH